MTLDFNKPETATGVGRELALTTQSLAERMALSTVVDLPSLEQARMDRQAIGDACKNVEKFFDPFISMAHQLHKSLCDRKNEILGPLLRLDAEKRIAIREYNEQERTAREQRARELVEAQRVENQSRAVAEAASLEASGEHAMAAAVVAEAIAAPAPVVVLPDPVKAVQRFKRSWKWRFVNNDVTRAMQLIPREFLVVDQVRLNRYATAMKDSAKVPGIEFYYVDDPIR